MVGSIHVGGVGSHDGQTWWGWSIYGHTVAACETREQAERYLREWHEREVRRRALNVVSA